MSGSQGRQVRRTEHEPARDDDPEDDIEHGFSPSAAFGGRHEGSLLEAWPFAKIARIVASVRPRSLRFAEAFRILSHRLAIADNDLIG